MRGRNKPVQVRSILIECQLGSKAANFVRPFFLFNLVVGRQENAKESVRHSACRLR